MHRLAQFHTIACLRDTVERDPPPWDGATPQEGTLSPALLRALCATLATHTSTADSCWFCLWDGYAWLHGNPNVLRMTIGDESGSVLPPPSVPPVLSPAVLDGPRVHLPHRDYLLFTGALEAASNTTATVNPGGW